LSFTQKKYRLLIGFILRVFCTVALHHQNKSLTI
jgi:hypothetical protein